MVLNKELDIRDVSDYMGKGKVTEEVFYKPLKEEEKEDKGRVVGRGACVLGCGRKKHRGLDLIEGNSIYSLLIINIT